MRDHHGFHFAGANLMFGAYDLAGAPSRSRFDGRGLILDGPSIGIAVDMFVPDASKLRDPDVSPLYADLSDLGPALFTVGTLDPLLDDSLFMYARWLAAGNAAEIEIFPGCPHGFQGLPAPEGPRAASLINDFLVRCIEA